MRHVLRILTGAFVAMVALLLTLFAGTKVMAAGGTGPTTLAADCGCLSDAKSPTAAFVAANPAWREMKQEWKKLPTRCIKENKQLFNNAIVSANQNNNSFRPYNDKGKQYPANAYPSWFSSIRTGQIPFRGGA